MRAENMVESVTYSFEIAVVFAKEIIII